MVSLYSQYAVGASLATVEPALWEHVETHEYYASTPYDQEYVVSQRAVFPTGAGYAVYYLVMKTSQE